MKKVELSSSVGKKIIMGLTGLFLCSFLVVHLAGNLLLFKQDGGATFNAYSDFMEHNAVILILEIVLFAGILFHIIDGIVLTLKNKSARPTPYAMSNPSANSTWFSRNMGLTGSLVFAFLVIHIRTFMIGQRFQHQHSSMFDSVKINFSNFYYSGFYVVAIAFLAFHLNHGFQSAFQSLGINHPFYTPIIKGLGLLFSILIPIGFMTIPIYFYAR